MTGFGPALGQVVTINAPKRRCHGTRGTVVWLHLATNEATVQLPDGVQHLVSWDQVDGTPEPEEGHGTRGRYAGSHGRPGCRCLACTDAAAKYMREYRARERERAAYDLDLELDGKAIARAADE